MGNKGYSRQGFFGDIHHYDEHGHKTGTSRPGMFGGYNHSSSGGCYIATCVYGSYDCPEVWILRRFRDNTLATNVFGRAFIKTYYAISPTLVKWFGVQTGLKNCGKPVWIKWFLCLKTKE